jgi:hypothetical protein
MVTMKRLSGCVAAGAMVVLNVAMALGQGVPAQHPVAAAAAAPNERDVAATRHELLRLLKMSPTLTAVIARDPSLLGNQEYVTRNNPQLAAFLAQHADIARNPDFYLFTELHPSDGGSDEALQRAVWPEYTAQAHQFGPADRLADSGPPVIAVIFFFGALAWLIRTFMENGRWGKIFKLQSEVHGRLIEKFNTAQDLAAYMETEAGRRFLEAAPIPVSVDRPQQKLPNVVARVLTTLQIGVVMLLVGIGFLALRNVTPESAAPMTILGTLVLMPGIGFMISAGVTWVLATRMGLMPAPGEAGGSDARTGSQAAEQK